MTDRPSLTDLERGTPFTERHIGPRPDELATMLAAIGAESLDELADAAVPASIRDSDPVPSTLPPAGTETEVLDALRALAARNTVTVPMIGQGYHGTVTPPVIRRHVLENPAWYTAYTPYQPEISQGRLEALLTFQTTVADLTGLPVAGASLLDEATAAAEAMTLLRRANRATSPRFLVDVDTLPQTRDVLATRAAPAWHRARAVRPGRGAPRGRVLRRAAVLPGRVGRRARPAPGHRRRARTRRAGRRRRRPAGPHPAHPARRARGRRGRRYHPALRGAARVRRSARRLPLGARQARPPAARQARRAVPRRRRPPRAAAGPADPRAAHPPREGHLEHLHGAGAARRRSRPATPSTTARTGWRGSPAGPTAWPPCSPRACARAASRSSTTRSSTPSGRGCRAGPRRSPTPRTQPGSRCTASTPTPWASRAPSSPRWPTWRRCGPRSACTPTPPSSTRARPTRCPPSSRAPATTSRTRSSTSTARRRR